MNDLVSSVVTATLSNTFDDNAFNNYFQGIEETSNLYELALDFAFNTTLTNFNFHHVLLGYPNKFIKIKLEPSKVYELDLSGEIKNGRLLYINYTPEGNGNLFPVELLGNSPFNTIYNTYKRLYPYVINSNVPATDTYVNISYAYVPEEIINDTSLRQISEAYQCYFNQEYVETVIKLQIATEFILGKFLYKYKQKCKLENYFINLTINLNKITNQNNLLPCPQFLIDSLDAMRDKRNKIIHGGGNVTLNQDDVRKWCVDTLFFCKYFKIIHKI